MTLGYKKTTTKKILILAVRNFFIENFSIELNFYYEQRL